MEKELALELLELLKASNVKTINLPRALNEVETTIIKFLKYNHTSKTDLARCLKIKRTTLTEKMKKLKISM